MDSDGGDASSAAGVDRERYRRSMARLSEIMRGINDTANAVSTYRCPYKNARDRCTAKFGCRNQNRRVPRVSCSSVWVTTSWITGLRGSCKRLLGFQRRGAETQGRRGIIGVSDSSLIQVWK